MIRDYAALHDAMRARAEALNISRETIDDLAGLPDKYASKVLGPNSKKSQTLVAKSFFPILRALGWMIVLVDDPEALARTKLRGAPRDQKMIRRSSRLSIKRSDAPPWVIRGLSKRAYLKEMGRKGGQARAANLTVGQMKAIGRKAIRARWRKRALERAKPRAPA